MGKDNIERTAYEIIGNEMKMLGSRPNQAGGYAAPASQQEHSPQMTAEQYAAASGGRPVSPPERRQPVAPVVPVNDIDDDIPF